MIGQAVLHSSVDAGWRTPKPLYHALTLAAGGIGTKALAVNGFGWDLAAAPDATLEQQFYLGPGSAYGEDALAVSWVDLLAQAPSRPRRGFLNPPYSERLRREGVPGMAIDDWAQKAWRESARGVEVWGLFPYSTQTEWWRRYVEGHASEALPWPFHAAAEVWRLPYRVAFDPSEKTLAQMREDFTAGKRRSPEPSGAGHNVAVVIWRANPGFVGTWQPALRYWSYR